MKKWKISLTVEVSENWIEDGFDLNHPEREEQLKDAITSMLPYAHEHEMKVSITSNVSLHRPSKQIA